MVCQPREKRKKEHGPSYKEPRTLEIPLATKGDDHRL